MIRLVDVSKYYRSNQNVALGLHKINLEFSVGEFVAITGESGSGKSTLLNVISGTDSYEDGELYFKGQETSYYDQMDWERYRKENIGFVYQNYNLIDSFSVMDNVKLAMHIVCPDIPKDEAEKKALEYLAKVGLAELAKKRASQLSSGQKQRLSIARALAKETDIIVADEPTGNLDSENSKQFIEILKELSKEKLVLIVTHNYDEVAPYVTRKIRMYEGEVREDYVLRKNLSKESSDTAGKNAKEVPVLSSDKEIRKQEQKADWKLAGKTIFTLWRSMPYSTGFLMIFYIFVFAAIFIFYGSFDMSLDYSTTKDFVPTTYINGDATRISAKKADESAITDEDVEYLKKLAHVEEVDKYDVINDISYFLYPEQDYTIQFRSNTYGNKQPPIKSTAKGLSDDKFLKTVYSLEQKDITAGRMPEGLNEIVINSEDTSIVGKNIRVYLRRKINWNEYMVYKEFTITGLTDKGDIHQIYVSDALGKNLNVVAVPLKDHVFYGMFARGGYGLAEETTYDLKEMFGDALLKEVIFDGIFIRGDFGTIHEFIGVSGAEDEAVIKKIDKLEVLRPIYIVNTQLKSNQIRLSENYYADVGGNDQNAVKRVAYIYHGKKYDRKQYSCEVVWENSKHGNTVLEISEEFFNQLYPDQSSYQASVYVTDYAYVDRVMRKLEKKGFEAVSVMRVGSTEYNPKKVSENTTRMFISLGALAVIFVIGILEIRGIMAGRNSDYEIMQLLGLGSAVIDKMNFLDVTYNMIVAGGGTIVIANIAKWLEVPYVASAVRYYEINDYLIYIVVIAVMMNLLHRSIKKVKRKNLYKEK